MLPSFVKTQPGLSGDSILLANDTSVRDYREFERLRNKIKIAELIRSRFTERYVVPIEAAGAKKHGFCTMAISCLMIESLESLRRGWEHSKRFSKEAFQSFFQRNSDLRGIPGILSTPTFDAEFCIRLKPRADGGLHAVDRCSMHRPLNSTPRRFTAR